MAGIYVHIPFCKKACYYCDFHFSTSLKRKNEMMQAIIQEIKLRKNEWEEEKVTTIYFGGGTPSLLNNEDLQAVFEAINNSYKVEPTAEITLEANPDDLTSEKIKMLTDLPINRLSIGIQSFFDDDLEFMNRAHSALDSKKCLKEALNYFDNISVDLIYGLPNMSNKKWLRNLKQVFDFGIQHISSYALTVERKTALYKFIESGKIPPLNEELALQHFNSLVRVTEKKGYEHYEISNFAKPNYISKHNSSYWLGEKYIGFGPSSHSFDCVNRSWNISNNMQYIKGIQANKLPSKIETLTLNDRFNEAVMMGLRTSWGISFHRIETEFGALYLELLKKNAQPYIEKGMLIIEPHTFDSHTLVTTKKGKFLADGIASDLFIVDN